MPPGLDWQVWRLLTSPDLAVTMTELSDVWTIEDVEDAHASLDLLDRLRVKAMRPKKKGG